MYIFWPFEREVQAHDGISHRSFRLVMYYGFSPNLAYAGGQKLDAVLVVKCCRLFDSQQVRKSGMNVCPCFITQGDFQSCMKPILGMIQSSGIWVYKSSSLLHFGCNPCSYKLLQRSWAELLVCEDQTLFTLKLHTSYLCYKLLILHLGHDTHCQHNETAHIPYTSGNVGPPPLKSC